MTAKSTEFGTTWYAKSLHDVDQEIARLATLCKVQILDRQVIERVLRNDASVCGAKNQIGFDKLRTMLMMHYHVREKAVAALGELETERLVAAIVESLRERITGQAGGSAPTK